MENHEKNSSNKEAEKRSERAREREISDKRINDRQPQANHRSNPGTRRQREIENENV